MDRVQKLVDEFLIFTCVVNSTPDAQETALKSMVNDLVFEDRLRTLNLLQNCGIDLTEGQKLSLLGGEYVRKQ